MVKNVIAVAQEKNGGKMVPKKGWQQENGGNWGEPLQSMRMPPISSRWHIDILSQKVWLKEV